MTPRFSVLVVLAALLACGTTSASPYTGPWESKVSRASVYSEFGNGDFIFRIVDQPAACFGFWVRRSDPGAADIKAIVLAALQSGARVSIYAHTNELWSGSGSPYCRIYNVDMIG